MSKCPNVRTSGRPDQTGRPDVRASGRPDVQTSGRPGVRTSDLDVPTSGRLDVQIPGHPDVQTSGRPGGRPDIRKPGYPFVCVPVL